MSPRERRKKGGNLAEISLRDLGLARTEDARPMIYPIFGTVSPKNNSSANGIFSFLRENLEKRKRFRRKELLKLHNVLFLLVYRFGNMWEKGRDGSTFLF